MSNIRKYCDKNYFNLIILLAVTIIIVLVMTSCTSVKEDKIPIPIVKEDTYVYDIDNIIDDSIENKINLLLIQLQKETEAEVVVVTTQSLLEKEIEDYSYELANTLGIGKKDKDNGVLLLISKSDERVRLEIGKGLEGCLNDSKCGRILDDYFVPYRQNNEYSEGTYKTIEAVISVIAKEYGVQIEQIDASLANQIEEQESDQSKKSGLTIIIIISIIVLVVIIDAFVFDGQLIFTGSSFGGRSGGSFGGGSFGGGGASR